MKQAPDFTLDDQLGNSRSLSNFKGQWLVLYFYPKDNTPSCTKEACNFRDASDALAEYGDVIVIGISKDSVRSHKRFADIHNLNFLLLSDPELNTIKAYGAWGPKKLMGREFLGTKRNTYIINPEGIIVKKYQNVTPKTHVAIILKDLKALKEKAKRPISE